MSQNQRLKELLEKLKAHNQKNNDPELNAIIEEYQSSMEEEEDDKGGNSPEPPDIP